MVDARPFDDFFFGQRFTIAVGISPRLDGANKRAMHSFWWSRRGVSNMETKACFAVINLERMT